MQLSRAKTWKALELDAARRYEHWTSIPVDYKELLLIPKQKRTLRMKENEIHVNTCVFVLQMNSF